MQVVGFCLSIQVRLATGMIPILAVSQATLLHSDQEWNQGLLSKGGKWYGSGVVLGLIGRNVAHRNHILRRAPEQVNLATSEERTLIETQGTELLGIKDMIEGGTFRSSQYVDFALVMLATQV